MPIVTMSLPVNVFMTALLAKSLDLPKPTIGLITAMPFIGNFLQLGAVPFLSRWKPPRVLTVLFASLHLAAWIAFIPLLSWIPRDDPARAGRILITWFLAASLCSAIGGISWNTWMQGFVPPRLRGKYFGRRNAILQLATLTFMLVAGWTLARWDHAIPAFQGIIVGAVLLRLLSIRWLWRIPDQSRRHPVARESPPLRRQFEVLRSARSIHAFIAFGAIWACAANMFGPFYHVFMFDQLGFSAFEVSICTTLSQLGGALSLPAWGQLLDRHGNKSVMALSLIAWQGVNFSWCLIDPVHSAWLQLVWLLAGITGAGFVLGQFTLLLKLIPLEARDLAMGANLAVVSLVAGLAPVLGGWLLDAGLQSGVPALTVYHRAFLVQPLLALSGCFLLLQVHEPLASRLSMVIGAMRNMRTLGGVLGLTFLVNQVYFRPARRLRTK